MPAADGGGPAFNAAGVNEALALEFDFDLGSTENVGGLAGSERGAVPFHGLVGIEGEDLLRAPGRQGPAMTVYLRGDGSGDHRIVEAAVVVGMGMGEPVGGDGDAWTEPQINGGEKVAFRFAFGVHGPSFSIDAATGDIG